MSSLRPLIVLFLACTPILQAADPVLKSGDRLAIVGDSITEQKLYSKFIETYLQACHPDLKIQCFQFGWGGERAPGFAGRMENDLIPWKPSVVTTCYGMNDGSYRAYDENIGKAYEQGMRAIIDRLKQDKVTVVVGGPGVVDSITWNRGNPDFDQVYNANLQQLSSIAQGLAEENSFPHADVFAAMMSSMIAAKQKLGDEYHVAGGDGVHPSANGQLVMAYAFLKALGVDGQIGTIQFNAKTGKATASAGHKVVSAADSVIRLESSRYPFCFQGNDNDPNGTLSILPYVPFNQDLNRFTLQVTDLTASSAEVQFGEQSRTFSREQLREGINLAAEFPQNPFSQPFQNVLNEVGSKQGFETMIIKSIITNFRNLGGEFADDQELQQAVSTVRSRLLAKNAADHQRVQDAVQPVSYEIRVSPRN